MSKKARNKRMIRAMSVPVPLPAVPRAAHEHNRNKVRTNGNRIRRGCDACGGAWGKWRQMTDAEQAAYKPIQEATVDGSHDGYELGHDYPGRVVDMTQQVKLTVEENPYSAAEAMLYGAQEAARETGKPVIFPAQQPKGDPTPQEVSSLKALLQRAQTEAIANATGTAQNIADQAGVTVHEGGDTAPAKYFVPTHSDTPAFRRTGTTGIDADNANRKTWPVKYPTYGDLPETHGELLAETMPDHGAGEEDYRDEYYEDRYGHSTGDDAEDEEQAYSDKRMCYVGIDGGELRMMSEEDAYQELDAARSYNADVPHVIGDAEWDRKEGDWVIPSDIMDDYTAHYGFPDTSDAHQLPEDDDVDDAKVEAFVAESFGDGSEPTTEDKPRWYVELDFGNDNRQTFAWAGEDYGASHLVQYLNLNFKRDDLEFAARQLGIRGVTTKVKKEFLIRALVVMADTSLVKEHALNRAAVMLRTAPVKDSDTEWSTHYAPDDK